MIKEQTLILRGLKEIADYLGVSKEKAKEWIEKEGLPVWKETDKTGTKFLANRKHISNWLDEYSYKKVKKSLDNNIRL